MDRPLPAPAALALLALLVSTPAAATTPGAPPPEPPGWDPETTTDLALGVASFAYDGASGARVRQQGAALQLRVRQRSSPLVGVGFTLTWGLTDWDRAREWIDAGNAAGAWTTDRIRAVGDWAVEEKETAGLRILGAMFADLFLGMTYAAVPACYLGSVGGATSHVQADVAASLHAGAGPVEAWVEGGIGVLALPVVLRDWDFGVGPVLGVGADIGPVRIGARFLWSPTALHTTSLTRGTVFTGAATVSVGHR